MYYFSAFIPLITHIYIREKKIKKIKQKNRKKFIHINICACFCAFCVIQDVTNLEQKKIFIYIFIYIYINLPKLGFYGLDTVPFRPCIFTDFLILYIFCTKMGVLGVLGYVYTYGRKKIKKSMEQKKKKFFIYINTKHSPKHPFTPF